MVKKKNLMRAVILFISLIFIFLSILPSSFSTVRAEEGELTGDLAQYATNEVGKTDQGWTIYSSQNPNAAMLRAVGNSGQSVSKDYGGFTSYTQIITVKDNAGVDHIAYCITPDLNVPNGTDYAQQIMNNDRLKTVLYYGYGGGDSAEFMAREGGNVNNAYMDTWMAARLAYGETTSNPAVNNDPNIRWLLDHAVVQNSSISVSGSSETSWNKTEQIQETGWFTTNGSGTYSLELDGLGISAKLSDGRTISSTLAGIPVGTSFKLFAGPEKEGTVTVPIKTEGVSYDGMIFIPTSDPYAQSIVAGVAGTGAGQDTSVSAVFKKRTAPTKVEKTDERHLALNLDKNQASGDASLDGAVFGLYKDQECTQLVVQATVTNGMADFGSVVLGQYYIKEISAGDGYKLNENIYPVEVWDEGIEGVTEIENEVKTNPVSIIKYAIDDPDNVDDVLNPLANVDFTLTLKSAMDNGDQLVEGDNLFSGTTNEKGRISWENVPVGTYILHEVKTPEGYIAIEDQTIVVDGSGEEIEIPLSNKLFYGDLIIVKKDAESGKDIPAAGVKFKVIDLSTMTFVKQSSASTLFIPVDTFKTNDEGKAVLPQALKSGSYAVVEVEAPDGYLSAGLTSANNCQTYTVDGKEYKGVPVTISQTTCDKIEVDGKTEYSKTLSIYDQPAKGKIKITKTGDQLNGTTTSDSKYGLVTEFIFDQKNLAGVSFDIYADEDIITPDGTVHYQKGDKVQTITTGDDGTITSGELYLGKYKVVEVEAPDGYVNNEESRTVTLKYKGETVNANDNIESVAFENDRQNVQFKLEKLEQEIDNIEQEGDGVTIHYKDVPANTIDFGLYTSESMSDGAGGTVAADTLVSVMTVKNGDAKTVENLPEGNYYLKELSTKDHLEDNTNHYKVSFAVKGNEPLQVVEVNNGEPIMNYYVERDFEFTKTDISDGMLIPGVTVNIYDNQKDVIFTGQTDENGQISITLPAGKYYYQEVDAPAPYLVDDSLNAFEITKGGDVVKAEMSDAMAMGNILLTKTGEDRNDYKVDESGKVIYEESALAGAEFVVKAHEDIVTPEGVVKAYAGDTVAYMTTDEKGEATVESAYFMTKDAIRETTDPVDLTTFASPDEGTENSVTVKEETALFLGTGTVHYDVIEVKAPEGYRLDETVHTVELSFKDNQTALVEVNLDCFDESKGGKINVTKVDKEAQTALANAEIKVMNSDKEVIYTTKTDSEGKFSVEKLPDGCYYYQEVKAPDGYKLNDTIYQLTVNDNETTSVTLANEKEEIVNTGIGIDDSGIILAGVLAIAGMGVAGISMYQRKQRH